MRSILSRYTHWLHTQWPAGVVEKLPEVQEDGSTNVPGVYVVGDLTGIPLLKFSSDTGAKAVSSILKDPSFDGQRGEEGVLDLAIIGAGVSGVAAAMEAKKAGLNYKIYEASEIFSTVANFPKRKPIYTYPTDMVPEGDLQFQATVKEDLMVEMEEQRQKAGVEITYTRIEKIEHKGGKLLLHHEEKTTPTLRVIIAIGRSGNFRKLDCPGENLDKVSNRLHDPKDYAGKQILVVGGGDSALETAIALTCCGAHVTLSYRKKEFSRPKPDNLESIQALEEDPSCPAAVERPSSERVTTAASSSMRGDKAVGSLTLALATSVKEIKHNNITLVEESGEEKQISNDAVFSMIGREAPLDFFRRSGINISGEWRKKTWVSFSLFFAFCIFLYHWKSYGQVFYWIRNLGADPTNLVGSTINAMKDPSFYYTLAYSLCVVIFGIKRIRRRKTPYVKVQTYTLMAIQVIPLFILPYILLPWIGNNNYFGSSWGQAIGNELFPNGSYWHSFGLILAWPLFIYNVFTDQPMVGWLVISFVQTFVIIPFIVWRWGKGAFCGWICPCGALAETLGDTHRHKMPHGPFWNRFNMLGQAILALAFFLLFLRIVTWIFPSLSSLIPFYKGLFIDWKVVNYKYIVDLWLAGIIGVGCYFWYSGRVWCRFACPLAALMHIYARFSRFRIFADKKKCISCNVCTSVCHQGIDIMNFANKGLPMEDPECVRCSACVQQCPTGVLSFGRFDNDGGIVFDQLPASRVQMMEKKQD